MEILRVTTRNPDISEKVEKDAPRKEPKEFDEAVTLDFQNTRQKIRLCASRPGLPPLLVVQAGPGLPLLNEVSRFQSCLQLETDFTVAYWEQRGCGVAPSWVAQTVTMKTQQDDLEVVIRWLSEKNGAKSARVWDLDRRYAGVAGSAPREAAPRGGDSHFRGHRSKSRGLGGI